MGEGRGRELVRRNSFNYKKLYKQKSVCVKGGGWWWYGITVSWSSSSAAAAAFVDIRFCCFFGLIFYIKIRISRKKNILFCCCLIKTRETKQKKFFFNFVSRIIENSIFLGFFYGFSCEKASSFFPYPHPLHHSIKKSLSLYRICRKNNLMLETHTTTTTTTQKKQTR
jgi:hypothetical protein